MPRYTASNESPETRLSLFDFAFKNAPIGIALVGIDGCILRGNEAFARLVGILVNDVIGTPFSVFTHPADLEADMVLFHEVLDGKRDGYVIEKRYIRPAGDIVHVRIHVGAMRNANGEVVRFITQIEDITAYKENERVMAERAAQLELALEAVRGGFWQMDIVERKFETSDRLARFIGGPEAARLDLDSYLHKINGLDGDAADLTQLISGNVDQHVAEYRLSTVAGERWMRCDRRLLRDADGTPTKIVGMAIDFTEDHQKIADLERSSSTDSLTGLLNRRGLTRQFELMTSATGYAILAIDLDGFKEVNDLHGHPVGDVVLMETARRVLVSVRDSDLACRIGGDEFVVVVAGDKLAAKAIALRIVETLRMPFNVVGHDFTVTASVGGTWSAGKVSLEALNSCADQSLYEAKAAGKDCIRFR